MHAVGLTLSGSGRGLVDRAAYFVRHGYVVVLQDTHGRWRDAQAWPLPEAESTRSYPTANRFKAGHRIRIDVSSSNFPRFDVNPNTGEPLGRHRRSVPADNSIHHEPAHPSHVVLPLVEVAPEEG